MTLPNQHITPIPAIDPATGEAPSATPDLWNSRYLEIDANFAAMEQDIGEIEGVGGNTNERIDAIIEAIASQGARITGIENNSANSVAKALKLDWLYSSRAQVKMELFWDSWTLLPGMKNKVIDAVAGDDSLDVDTTEHLVIGHEYVIFDGQHHESVVVTDILTDSRIRVNVSLQHSYKDADLRRCSWEITGGGAKTALGGVYYSGKVKMAGTEDDRGYVIRRSDDAALFEVYFKDAHHAEWQFTPCSWQRAIAPDVIDMEYVLPVEREFEVKVVVSGADPAAPTVIQHMVLVGSPTGLGGQTLPPLPTVIVSPVAGATGVQEQPAITTGSYGHPCRYPLAGTECRIATDEGFTNIIYTSEVEEGLSCVIPKAVLLTGTIYFVQARHTDTFGGVSDWSEPISFTTAAEFAEPDPPTIVAPKEGGKFRGTSGVVLVSSEFATSTGAGDTHKSSRWQVATDPGFVNVLWDSQETTEGKTAQAVPPDTLQEGHSYYVRVRHKGTTIGWSEWSGARRFDVITSPLFMVRFKRGSHQPVFGLSSVFGFSQNIYVVMGRHSKTLHLVKMGWNGICKYKISLGNEDFTELKYPVVAEAGQDGTVFFSFFAFAESQNYLVLGRVSQAGQLLWSKQYAIQNRWVVTEPLLSPVGDKLQVFYLINNNENERETRMLEFSFDGDCLRGYDWPGAHRFLGCLALLPGEEQNGNILRITHDPRSQYGVYIRASWEEKKYTEYTTVRTNYSRAAKEFDWVGEKSGLTLGIVDGGYGLSPVSPGYLVSGAYKFYVTGQAVIVRAVVEAAGRIVVFCKESVFFVLDRNTYAVIAAKRLANVRLENMLYQSGNMVWFDGTVTDGTPTQSYHLICLDLSVENMQGELLFGNGVWEPVQGHSVWYGRPAERLPHVGKTREIVMQDCSAINAASGQLPVFTPAAVTVSDSDFLSEKISL